MRYNTWLTLVLALLQYVVHAQTQSYIRLDKIRQCLQSQETIKLSKDPCQFKPSDIQPYSYFNLFGAIPQTGELQASVGDTYYGYNFLCDYILDQGGFQIQHLNNTPVRDSNGNILNFAFNCSFDDNESNTTKNIEILEQQLYENNVDFYVGSHPRFEPEQAELISSNNKILFQCCVGPDKYYTYENVFGVQVSNLLYTDLFIKQLSLRSIQSIAIISNLHKFESSTCKHAEKYALEFKLNTTARYLDSEEKQTYKNKIESFLQEIKNNRTEVLLGCVEYDDAINIMHEIDKLQIPLKSIFFTVAPSKKQFVDDLGNLSEQVLTAGQWHHTINYTDQYLNDTQTYVQLYEDYTQEKQYYQEATYTSAGASAVIEYFMFAIKDAFIGCNISATDGDVKKLLYDQSSIDCSGRNLEQLSGYEIISRQMMGQNASTFFGEIRFNEYGRNEAMKPATIQILPEENGNLTTQCVLPDDVCTSADIELPQDNRYPSLQCREGYCQPDDQFDECQPCQKGTPVDRGDLGADIIEFVQEKEEILEILYEELEVAFLRRRSLIQTCQCIPNRCSNTMGEDITCGLDFGLVGDPPTCSNATGTLYSLKRGMVASPQPLQDPANMTDGFKASICLMNQLQTEAVPKLIEKNITTWAYIGMDQGPSWSYPGQMLERNLETGLEQWNYCKPFDVRTRPWYHEGATGPLDIVFLVDISSSMLEIARGSLSKWDIVKDSLLKFIDTLTFTDSFNIVFFNNQKERISLWRGLLAGTEDNRKMAKDIINTNRTIFPSAGTNFEYAFKNAFSELLSGIEAQNSTNCEKVILFLTDGKDNYVESNKTRTQDLLNMVQDLQDELQVASGKQASIFSFSIGEEADDSVCRQLSCQHNGSWAPITSQDDPLTVFNIFLKFIASARNAARIYWSEVYEDGWGLGQIISAVMPVYTPRNDENIPGVLFGVAAFDIKISDFEKLAGNQTKQVIRILQQESLTCDEITFNSCLQQVLRGADVECADLSYQPATCTKFDKKYYQRSKDLVRWIEAKDECEMGGGILAVPNDAYEQGFIAGMSAYEGSWIGLSHNGLQWVPEDQTILGPNQHKFWAYGQQKIDPTQITCATIAPSGTSKNMYTHSSTEKFTYICEFDTPPESCGEDVVDVGDIQYKYFMPRIEQCSTAESLDTVNFFDTIEVPWVEAGDLFCLEDFRQPEFNANFTDNFCCMASVE